MTKQARRFAKAMKASLIFCSTSHSINVQKIFKIILSKVFDLKCVIPEIHDIGAPILEYISYDNEQAVTSSAPVSQATKAKAPESHHEEKDNQHVMNSVQAADDRQTMNPAARWSSRDVFKSDSSSNINES